jgi:hypothetical protein
MASSLRRVTYFNTSVKDRPGEAYQLLSQLAHAGVNLLAVSAVPVGPNTTQLVLFPESVDTLTRAAARSGMVLSAPQHAFLVQGDDELGALVGIHQKLYDAHINVYASNGVTDGKGGYGYIVYVREADFESAANALGI